MSSDFPTLDPAQATDTESIGAIQLMDQPLFTYSDTGALVGLLAQGFAWSNSGTVLTVQLNPGATFADGSPVLATDVVYSIGRLLAKDTASPHASSFQDLEGYAQLREGKAAAGLTASGPRTVVFRLQHALPYLPELLAMPSTAVLEQKVADVPGSAQRAWWFAHSAGSGPYVLASSTPGQSLRLAPSPHYWGQASGGGPFAPVEFRIVSDAATQTRLFAAGQLDVLAPAPPTAFAGGLPPAGARLLEAGNEGVSFLGFDTTRPPFDNPLVRQAVAYALNKPKLLAAAGPGSLAAGLVPPGVPGFDANLAPYPYAPARAQALLAQAGLASGTPVTLLTIAASGTVQQGSSDAMAAQVAKDLDAVGFDVTVQRDTWQEYYRDLAAGRANLFEGTWLADYPDPQDFVFHLLGPGAAGQGPGGYASRAFTPALQAAEAASTSSARLEAYAALERVIYQEVPILPEVYTESTVLLQPWVHPASAAVFLRPPLLPQLQRVWIQQSRKANG